jgi:DNA-binding MltR family transcriptional regulator
MWLLTANPKDTAAIVELQTASDRAAAIVAASFVEVRLTGLLKEAFIKEKAKKDETTVYSKMFHSSGPLGSFSSRIRLAYLLGLVSTECFKNLENMKEIRNQFAHHLEIGSFDTQSIRARCKNFTMVDKYVIDSKDEVHGHPKALFGMEVLGAWTKLTVPKERYILTAQMLCIGLQHATPNTRPRRPHF